jgi:ubiquinone/menaquinone biosynthesis C-methylase UbiE
MTAFEEERKRLREKVWSFLDIKQGAKCLDVGIGHTAYSLNKLLELGLDVTSVDINLDVLHTHKTNNAHFVQCSANQLPFKENAFNLSLAYFTFHEIDPALHKAAACELYRVSKKIMIVEPAVGKDPLFRRYQKLWTVAMHSIDQYEDYQPMEYWSELLQQSGTRGVTSEKLPHTVRLCGNECEEYMKGAAEEMREDGVSEEYVARLRTLSQEITNQGMLFSDINVIVGHVK